jgi:hypothetical protein
MLENRIRIQPTIMHAEVYDYFKREFNLMLDDSKINRAVREARELVEGSEKEQYGMIWDYANELRKSNVGSTVKVNTIPMPDSPP